MFPKEELLKIPETLVQEEPASDVFHNPLAVVPEAGAETIYALLLSNA
ncbi:hypothetical protein [Faecalibacter rhinopitheci]|uniref:Uncharacterized protein n=1 Tax=Faecalibacter rhinopitheci TaxID=2779678 RepID=A0A8J7FVD4_9FLAO|nr:hypothetical protein [Faecalibacter rhinopitheci]MBF0596148.1 hypothetical protein [Faecalibacter rhinopitheci]